MLTHLFMLMSHTNPVPCGLRSLSSASEGADSYQSNILDAAETALFNSQTATNDNVLTTLANMTSLVVCASSVTGFWAYSCLTKLLQTDAARAAPARWPVTMPAPSVKWLLGPCLYVLQELFVAPCCPVQLYSIRAALVRVTAAQPAALTALCWLHWFEPELLLPVTNADCSCLMQNPVTGPDAFESYSTANPVWQALDTAFQQFVLTNSSITPTTVYYYRRVYGPLLEMFREFPSGTITWQHREVDQAMAALPGPPALERCVCFVAWLWQSTAAPPSVLPHTSQPSSRQPRLAAAWVPIMFDTIHSSAVEQTAWQTPRLHAVTDVQ